MNSNPYHVDLLVIGAGPAGQQGAREGASSGKKVLIVEQESKIGGSSLHQGPIPSKTIREISLSILTLRNRSGHIIDLSGINEIYLPTLLMRTEEVLQAHDEQLRLQLEQDKIELWHGQARFISPHEIEITSADRSKKTVYAQTILIATGSRPRVPVDITIDHEHIYDRNSILSMRRIPASLTVIGSGVIACEYASIFAALGTKVTIIDKTDRPLGLLDSELSQLFVDDLKANGNEFLGKKTVESVRWDGISSVITTLQEGDVITSEKCLFAQGRVANLNRLNIEAAGLTVTERGLLAVNEFGQTLMPHIYAAGGVVGLAALASSSMIQGRRAISHALGKPVPTYDLVPTGIYTIPEMSSVGLTETDAIKRYGRCIVGRAKFSDVLKGHLAEIKNGQIKLVCDSEGKKLLGVHIFGEGATELIHIGQMVLATQGRVDVFVESIFNFPTLADIFRIAAINVIKQRS